MNKAYLSVIPLFLAISSARFLQSVPVTTTNTTVTPAFNSTLKCGDCVAGNFTYCFVGTAGQVFPNSPVGVCCRNTSSNCSVATNTSYTCTSQVGDQLSRFKMCPFVTGVCGQNRTFTIVGNQDKSCQRIQSVIKGEVCVFNVQARC